MLSGNLVEYVIMQHWDGKKAKLHKCLVVFARFTNLQRLFLEIINVFTEASCAVQKFSCAMLGKCARSCPPLLYGVNLLTHTYCRLHSDIIEIFKIIYSFCGYNAAVFLHFSSTPTYSHSPKIFQSSTSKAIRKNFLTNRIIISQNTFHNSVITAPNINFFNNRLDNHLRHKPTSFDHKATICNWNWTLRINNLSSVQSYCNKMYKKNQYSYIFKFFYGNYHLCLFGISWLRNGVFVTSF